MLVILVVIVKEILLKTTWHQSIHHDGSTKYVTIAARTIDANVKIRLRVGRDAPIEKIYLRTCPDGEQALSLMTPMKVVRNQLCRYWEIEIKASMPRYGYRFLLHTREGIWHFNAAGLHPYTPTDSSDFKLLVSATTPEWIHQSVFYQIFPDRFADGDTESNVKTGEYLSYGTPVVAREWGELPRPHNQSGGVEFFGGDLIGIANKLDYLQELGVNAIYLNPIFTAPSNHKYDTADFFQVDAHFGGNEALIALRKALSERNMRLILDIVVNHCGSTHSWFTDAQADINAPTAEFFTFYQHPKNYARWLGIGTLPKLNYRSELLREVIYNGDNSIMKYWLKEPYAIDGWRIDVANMLARQGENQLGHKIGRGIRRAIKAIMPEAFILGEHFHDGTPHLQGEELDASMNYRGFTFPLLQWLAGFSIDGGNWAKELSKRSKSKWLEANKLSSEALIDQWRTFMAAIPWQIASQQFNLLSTHDIPRILTILGEDQDLASVAAVLLMTFPGVPSIYYGDEIGMVGGADPDNRRCMIWDDSLWNHRLFDHYRNLIKLRRSLISLQQGGIQFLYGAKDSIAYLREAEDQQQQDRLIVVARRKDDGLKRLLVTPAAIADGTTFRELLSGREGKVHNGWLTLTGLKACDAQIWQEI